MTGPVRFSARLIVPGDGPPIPSGVIEVGDGMITDLFPGPDNTATDLGNVVLLPGLVNTHTHLEFSATPTPFPANAGMAAWIGEVVMSRSTRTNHINPVRTGLDELNTCGTAAVGEIATTDWPTDLLHENDPTCVVFREIIGLRSDRCTEGITIASDFLDGNTTKNCRLGLSPHAPYSVHPDLYQELVGLAASRDVPLATHIAESPDELELLAHGTGPMRERLESLNAWDGSS
ncbi:MAG: amidohydrolase family protein, partial [Planctomycetota bacterium]|nr:amidohydrolase family protein [Planctomycetota bacterium]